MNGAFFSSLPSIFCFCNPNKPGHAESNSDSDESIEPRDTGNHIPPPPITPPPNQRTQEFLQVNLSGRFNPTGNPEELTNLAIDRINFEHLQETQAQRTQEFLQANLHYRFRPDGNPEELKSLAIECINDNHLQYASEIRRHLCYRANDADVPDNDKQRYFNAACDIAIELTRHLDATHYYVRDITTLLTENNQTELINSINQSDRRPIFIDQGTVKIPRNELPKEIVDAIYYTVLNTNEFYSNGRFNSTTNKTQLESDFFLMIPDIFVLCTKEETDGKLGEIWHLFLKETLEGLQAANTCKHPYNGKTITGFKSVVVIDSDPNSGI